MSDLKQINNAENHLIVGSLEVLGDIEGSSMKTIKHTVSKLAESVQATNTAMENYWGGIGADNIVTPAEKEILYSKWQTLEQTFTAIRKIATDREITDTADYISLYELYDNLHDYIFNELKLFDEMDSKTVLPDSEHFNALFENYYKQQINFQSILSSTTTTIRTISSLNAGGKENEVVIYKNRFFKYTNGKWVNFDSPEYEGVLEELPEDVINHYFVAGKQGGFRDTFKIRVNKKYLVNEDEQYVTVPSKLFEYGYIYVYTQYNGWQKVSDKNNWRYTVALNDLIANNIPISTELENYLQSKEDSAVARANENANNAINSAINKIHTPVNLGQITSFPPSNYDKGDWFLWGANDTTGTYYIGGTAQSIPLIKGRVYKYTNTWNCLDYNSSINANYYMGYLKEILALMGADTTTEYFGTVFVNTILAAKAFIDNLTVTSVKSSNWDTTNGESGFYLNGLTGDFECNNGIFRGNIISGPLVLMPGINTEQVISFTSNQDCVSVYDNLTSVISSNSKYEIEGQLDSNEVQSIYIEKITSKQSGRLDSQYYSTGNISGVRYHKDTITTYYFIINNNEITKTSTKREWFFYDGSSEYADYGIFHSGSQTEYINESIGANLSAYVKSGTKKFKLTGIANRLNNSELNEVYCDNNRCLRLKTATSNTEQYDELNVKTLRVDNIIFNSVPPQTGVTNQVVINSYKQLFVKD